MFQHLAYLKSQLEQVILSLMLKKSLSIYSKDLPKLQSFNISICNVISKLKSIYQLILLVDFNINSFGQFKLIAFGGLLFQKMFPAKTNQKTCNGKFLAIVKVFKT